MTGIDDAHIFFAYAENIAKGLGITYSYNGVPVEGCTSLAWMFICAINFFLEFNELGVFICSCVLMVFAQFCWISLLNKIIENKNRIIGTILYCSLIVSCPGYITWMSITMMDVALWGMMIAWLSKTLYDVTTNRDMSLSVCFCFLIFPWVRLESFFVIPVFFTFLIIYKWRVDRTIILWTVTAFVSFVALELFRIFYFGYPLPNTFYAKVSPSLLSTSK